jgi:hypothetical protein
MWRHCQSGSKLLGDAEQARQQETLLEAAGEEVLERTRMIAQAIAQRVLKLTEPDRNPGASVTSSRPEVAARD